MSDIQRYKHWVHDTTSAMVTEKDGEYVTYADHGAAIRQARMDIIKVYEKYKHLDHLFSDKEWIDDGRPQAQALYDMWQAIRAEAVKE